MDPDLAGGRDFPSFLGVFMSSFRFCVLLSKTRRWRLSEYGIRFSPHNPCYGDVSSIVEGCVEVCLGQISRDSIKACFQVDLLGSSLGLHVYRLDPFDLYFSLSVKFIALVL